MAKANGGTRVTRGTRRGVPAPGTLSKDGNSYTTKAGETITVGNGVLRADVEIARELDDMPDYRSSAGIRPTGKAPRGMGGEYADRRAIADRLDTLDKRISNMQGTVNHSQRRKNASWNDSRARTLLPELRSVLSASTQIANGPGPWKAKRELISDLINSVQGA